MLGRATSPTITRYATAAGEQRIISLREGGRIVLAPQSSIESEESAHGARTINLAGEAYFDVASRADAPFVVRTGSTVTRVLGTQFNVRRYEDERATIVTVVRGRVGVHIDRRTTASPNDSTQSATLGEGMLAVADSVVTTRTTRDAGDADWTQGYLVFRNAPVQDVLAALGRWYGYRFTFADSTVSALAQRHLTVWVSTRSAREALSTLKLALNVDVDADGSTVTLRPRRADRKRPPGRAQRDTALIPFTEVGR
jgi:ferric-dicitrate binding protein FerR (iron transport regulator)